ncbi:MAG TPA: PAS domain S-box protein, partial [Polyangiales bacterium]
MSERVSQRDGVQSDAWPPLLVENLSLLEEAQELAHIGTWVFDRTTEEAVWSPSMYQIFGYPAGIRLTRSTYYDRVHADDLARVKKVIEDTLQDGDTWEVEHRVVRPDGSVRWLFNRSRVIRDEAGNALRVMGVVQDVTERKWALEELRASEERASRRAALVEWSREAIIGLDRDGTITSWNGAATRVFGHT